MIKSGIQKDGDGISRWQTPQLSDYEEENNPQSSEELRQCAYESGFKEGYEAGLELAKQETTDKLARLESFIAALERPFGELNEQVLEELVALCGRIAKGLVRRELRTEPETIMALVRDSVLALNTNAQKIQVFLHPDDAAIIRQLTHSGNKEQRWNILDDPSIPRGDCRVGSRDSLVDADLQTRINLIITGFLGDERGEKR